MHKDKRLVPVNLTVSKVSGIGEDMKFLGVLEVSAHGLETAACYVTPYPSPTSSLDGCMQPIRLPDNQASLWVRMDGTIMLACAAFEVRACISTRHFTRA